MYLGSQKDKQEDKTLQSSVSFTQSKWSIPLVDKLHNVKRM